MWMYVGAVLAILAGLRIYIRSKIGICHSRADLTGKTVIVTGANAGIGYETALDLAGRNAHVILACRRLEQGEQARINIQQETGNKNVVLKHLDLSSLESVRKFAKDVIETEEKLHILVNNAAIVASKPGKRTKDGLHFLMAVNHFGPFLLTNLLLDLLKKSSPSRIVNVSSIAYKFGKLEEGNFNFEQKEPPRGGPYGATKLGNILFTRELSRRLQGTGVTVNALHPGSINTNLFDRLILPVRYILRVVGFFFFKSPKEGAQTSIYCAVSEEMEGVSGQYLSECKIDKLPKPALDDTLAKQLWDASEKFTGLS